MKSLVCFLLIVGTTTLMTCNYARPIVTGDYIESGYYQLIYAADLTNLEGRRDEAFEKINRAMESCDLLNQPMYYEMSLYVSLLSERGDIDKARFYMEKLAHEYGYSLKAIEGIEYIEQIQSAINWSSYRLYLDSLSQDFYAKVDTHLIKELAEMKKHDQLVRDQGNLTDSVYHTRMAQTDSLNQNRMKEIILKYGYPNDKMIGVSNPLLRSSFTAMIMHFKDTAFFKQKLLSEIRKGNCPPKELANFVDSYARMDTAKQRYLYGIYNNVPKSQIKDIKNLDKRRMQIGMPPIEIADRRDSIIQKKYGL